jgi:hypothetical protein
MRKTKPRGKKSARPAAETKRPGGLPDLDAKTDWKAEHDTWWRHE